MDTPTASSKRFVPKQCLPRTFEVLDTLMGESSIRVIPTFLRDLPDIEPGSVIHDNGCGSGPLIKILLEKYPQLLEPSPKTTIHATDLMPPFVEGVKAHAESRGWGDTVQTAVMPAEQLSIAEASLTHSFTNFVIQASKEPQKVAAEIYRTLAPGGVAVVTTWAKMPHGGALDRTREALYGDRTPHGDAESFKPEWLRGALEGAGLGRVQLTQVDTEMEHESLAAWSNMAWSFMGMPPGGWTEKEERDWDTNTGLFGDECVKDGFEVLENGRARVKMVANVAIAWKDK